MGSFCVGGGWCIVQGKRSKTNAFLIWKQEAITARPDVELEAMKSKLREQQTILLKKFIKSLQSNVVSKNFTRWASYVAQKKSELELLNKTIAEREEKRKQLITRTLRRITHQCLSRGFQSWYNRYVNPVLLCYQNIDCLF